jgi:hypothetical protein
MPGRGRLSLLWHPYQRLWNWALIARIRARFGRGRLGGLLEAGVILADSLLLSARAARRDKGLGARRRHHGSERPQVLYIDCGVHKEAEQVQWMQRWFGDRYELHVLAFEAGGDHCRDAAAALAGLDRLRLHHLALVGPDYADSEVKLYKSSGKGKADSLFQERGEEFEIVPAGRLSSVLAQEGWDLARTPTVLRMNIEGAEQFVIADLLEAGLAGSIDGYYGMWDDLSKIDPAGDGRFRALLAEQGIATLTFNDRDLTSFGDRPLRLTPGELATTLRDLALRLRRRVIRRDIESAIERGLARVAANGQPR